MLSYIESSIQAIHYFLAFFMWSVNIASLILKRCIQNLLKHLRWCVLRNQSTNLSRELFADKHFILSVWTGSEYACVLPFIETLISTVSYLFSYFLLVSNCMSFVLKLSNKLEHDTYLRTFSHLWKDQFQLLSTLLAFVCPWNSTSLVFTLYTFFRTILHLLAQLLLEVN